MATNLQKLQNFLSEKKPETKAERFTAVLEALAKNIDKSVSPEDIAPVLKALVKYAKESRALTQKEVENLKQLMAKVIDVSEKSFAEKLNRAVKDAEQRLAKRIETIKDGQNGIDGRDGLDADPQIVADLVMGMFPEVIDKEQHEKEMQELREEIKRLEEEIKRRPTQVTGGVTNARIQQAFKYILKTEAPTGDIDGVNTTYTVTSPIFAVLTFSLDNQVIEQLPNYTINGNTIEFSTALPAAYSGKDFEIKYI